MHDQRYNLLTRVRIDNNCDVWSRAVVWAEDLKKLAVAIATDYAVAISATIALLPLIRWQKSHKIPIPTDSVAEPTTK